MPELRNRKRTVGGPGLRAAAIDARCLDRDGPARPHCGAAPEHGTNAPSEERMQAQPQPHAMTQAAPGGAAIAHEITHGPSFAMLRVDLAPGQTLIAEAGAMVARHNHVGMEVKMNAGKGAGFFALLKAFLIAIIRRFVGGETFFV